MPQRQPCVLCAFVLLLLLAPLSPTVCSAAPVRHGDAGAKKSASAKKHKSLDEQISAILQQPELARAHWGIDVMDLDSGRVVYALNPAQLFLPASNAKLFTTAAALAVAGPSYRFRTTVEADGKIDDSGHLQGDLVLVGRGDPNISGRVLPYTLKTERIPPHTQVLEEMADQVAHTGLKIVDGDLIGDDTLYSPQRYGNGWAEDDLQWIDGAPVSALTFNDNVIFVDAAPGEHPGDKAQVTTEPETNYFEIENRILTTASGVTRKIGVHREIGSRKVVLWGNLPLGDSGFKEPLAVDDPAEFAAVIFRGLLERRGIVINGKTRARHGEIAQFFDLSIAGKEAEHCCSIASSTSSPQPTPACCASPTPEPSPQPTPETPPTVLAEHLSLPFSEDVHVINKTSQNLHAELALRLAGKLSGNGGSFEGGSAAVRQFALQAGVHEEDLFLLDGSGLSRRDLVTPEAVAQLLFYAHRQSWGPMYEDSLPVAGIDGSLSERFLASPAAGLVHAKTGTLSHVTALSGYGQTLDGRRFAFSIFCNNHNLPNGKAIAAVDGIVRVLVTSDFSKSR